MKSISRVKFPRMSRTFWKKTRALSFEGTSFVHNPCDTLVSTHIVSIRHWLHVLHLIWFFQQARVGYYSPFFQRRKPKLYAYIPGDSGSVNWHSGLLGFTQCIMLRLEARLGLGWGSVRAVMDRVKSTTTWCLAVSRDWVFTQQMMETHCRHLEDVVGGLLGKLCVRLSSRKRTTVWAC